MAYVIKYIGNCAARNIDIRPLYQLDIASDDRIILVCEKDRAAQYIRGDIKVINSPVDAPATDAQIMILCPKSDAMRYAVECAYALYTGVCQIYMENDGLFTSDPTSGAMAQRIEKIDYDEVIEVCTSPFNNLNPAIVEKAKKRGVALHVLSYKRPRGKGTVIKEVLGLGTSMVKGIIKEPEICIVSLTDIPDVTGIAYRIFKTVSDAGIVVDMISLPASDYGSQDISFTVNKRDKHLVKKVLEEKQGDLGFSKLFIKDNMAKISVVGSGVQSGKGVAATVFGILSENNIGLHLISTSEIKISVIVDKGKADLAVHKIHNVFIK